MATVRVETVIDVPAPRVWDAIADVGAVHRRLLPAGSPTPASRTTYGS